MSPEKFTGVMELHGVMGSSPPLPITQEAFEGDPAHLQRLGKLHPGERADARDLWEYTQDLLYTDIQGSLLVYLFRSVWSYGGRTSWARTAMSGALWSSFILC